MPKLSGTIVSGALAVASAAVTAAPAWGAVIVDDFTTGPANLTSGQTASQTGLPTGNVIGGVRRIAFGGVRTEGGAPPGNTTMTVDTTGDGSFVVDGSPSVTPINSGLGYNGSTTSTSAMNVDLAPAGETGLVLVFMYANFSPDNGNFDINLSSPGGGFSKFLHVESSATPFTVFLPFHATANTFDEHHVTSISIGTGNGYWYNDFALAAIRSDVPEPSSMLAFSAASVPLLALRRRRRRITKKI